MIVSKNSKYQTHKKSSETLSTNPNDRVRTLCAMKGGLFQISKHPLLQNIAKLTGGSLRGIFFGKKFNNAEKTERGALWVFATSILSQNI